MLLQDLLPHLDSGAIVFRPDWAYNSRARLYLQKLGTDQLFYIKGIHFEFPELEELYSLTWLDMLSQDWIIDKDATKGTQI